MELTKDEFTVWRAMPETQAFLKEVDEQIEELEGCLGRGQTVNTTSNASTALSTALMVGEIRGLVWVLEECGQGSPEED